MYYIISLINSRLSYFKTKIQRSTFLLCEARPDLSGALFLFFLKKRKKRERRADKGAQT